MIETGMDYTPDTQETDRLFARCSMLSHSSTSSFSKSTVLHLRMGSRMASWEGWMRVWMSSFPQKSPRWIPSKDNTFLFSMIRLSLFIYIKDVKSLVLLTSCLSFCVLSDVPWKAQNLKMERRRRVKADSSTSSNALPNLTNRINRTNQISLTKTSQLHQLHPPPRHQLPPSLRSPPHPRWH